MSSVIPISGFRPRADRAWAVASVPYDVVDTEEARQLASGNEESFLRVIRSEIELDKETDPYSEAVYELARNNLAKFVERGTLVQDPESALYIYRLKMGAHVQTGIMGGVSVDEYDQGIIKTHEKTRVDKENDRTKHILTLRAHTEPVLLAYKSDSELKQLINKEVSAPPLYDFTAPDGISHTIWRATQSDEISSCFKKLPALYIADGHHRAASASRVAAEVKKQGISKAEGARHFLAVLFPHDELAIQPYNRVIKKLSLTSEQILERLASVCEITPNATATPAKRGECSMYLAGKWYKLAFGLSRESSPSTTDPVAKLDVSVLYDRALAPIFGIGDPRTDKNIDFVGGIHGTKRLEDLVNSGKAGCAFSMFPVSIEELFEIADQGLIMAPKSTWFEPKLRSGLLVHPF